jgi:sec-independent protein translocase protein TatA
MFDLSAIQILLVLGIALLVVGPKRLPEMGRSLGRGLRGFRDTVAGKDLDEPSFAESVVVDSLVVEPPAAEPASTTAA